MMKNLRFRILFLFLFSALSLQSFGQIVFQVDQPQSLAGNYDFTYANDWGANLETTNITDTAAFALDATNADSLGCQTIANASEVNGKIAVVYRGECQFSDKALNVQNAGAVALVIINSQPGGPVGMAGGTVAAQVTIPVVMISQDDGAALKDAISQGKAIITIRNNTGLFEYNVGTFIEQASRAKNYSIPHPLVENGGDTLRPVVWVFNNGSEEATGVKVSLVIDRDGTEVYNDTTDAAPIGANGDSLLYLLPEFVTNELGEYNAVYTVLADSTDEFAVDNTVEFGYWINDEGIYSKTTVSPSTGPVSTGYIRPNTEPFTTWQWCNSLQVFDAAGLSMTNVQFAAVGRDEDNFPVSLEDKSLLISAYKVATWDIDFTQESVQFSLEPIFEDQIFDFLDDVQEEFITVPFDEPFVLEDNTRYWTCLTLEDPEIRLAYDDQLDYFINISELDAFYYESITPIDVDIATGDFDGLNGFGGVGAIISILEEVNSVSEEVEALDLTPYPNPTTDFINIPVAGLGISGDVLVEVFDVAGSLVLSDNVCVKGSDMRLDVTGLSNGLHFFNLTFEDNSTTNFRVMITK